MKLKKFLKIIKTINLLSKSSKTMANYIKDLFDEFKSDGIMYIESEMLFNKLRTDWSKILELEYIFHFIIICGLAQIDVIQIKKMVRRYKKLVDEFKIKDELAVVLPRG